MRQQVTQQCEGDGVKTFFYRILVEVHFLKKLAFDKAHQIKFAVISSSLNSNYLFCHRTFIHVFNKLE